ncbi:fatty acid elongation protein, GNS1/SUR4 family, putative [Plasmodium malariae]|uniref:Elongation of fatty acids protein n=1 Tax=Plasmodium malariae TaxID=5858 RepID=A0A1C3K9K4_PLAMA|nr:fatty acid elongation protein, GNS1/SUR4 family, putative [Plasmodium malariae]
MITNIVTKTNDAGYFRILGNVRNYPKRPIFIIEEVFPFLDYFTFEWERAFTPFSFIEFVHNQYMTCPIVVMIYILFCKYGCAFMKKRNAFNLKWGVAIWNIFLSVFNMIVLIKLLPVLLYILYNYSFNGLLTIPPIYTCAFGPVGAWTMLFIISKYTELFDTVFLILRKKNITLLHWFHHATVLLYTWDTYFVEQPTGFLFIFINALVHFIMYFYYFLATIYNKALKWNIFVTCIQICQMLIGILLTIYCLYITFVYKYNTNWNVEHVKTMKHNFSFDNGHYISRKNVIFASLMYLSYLYLFAKYFFDRYLQRETRSKSA